MAKSIERTAALVVEGVAADFDWGTALIDVLSAKFAEQELPDAETITNTNDKLIVLIVAIDSSTLYLRRKQLKKSS